MVRQEELPDEELEVALLRQRVPAAVPALQLTGLAAEVELQAWPQRAEAQCPS